MNFFELFFQQLNQQSFDYVVLRNYETLLESYPSGDVDFLFSNQSFKKIKQQIYKLLPPSAVIYSQQRHADISITYYIYYANDNQLITLELATKLLFYQYNKVALINLPVKCYYFDTHNAIKKRKFYCSIPILNEDDYFLHLFVEYTINKKEKYRSILEKILSDKGQSLEVLNSYVFHYTKGSMLGFIKSACASLWVKLRSLFSPPGKFIVLMGPDGAGKTTIANLLAEKFHRHARFILRKQMNNRPRVLTLSRQSQADSISSDNETHVVEKSHVIKHQTGGLIKRLYHSARLLWHWLDFIIEYYFSVYPALVKGGFIFSERYIYDYLLFPERINPNAYYWVRQIAVKLMPKPTETIILLVMPEIIRQRKRELGLSDIENFNQRLLEFAKKNHFSVVPADSSALEVADYVVQLICQKSD
ncbi:MAG: hypothetical protein EP298_05085 [Gammaproteobacteria bacterium]|nr:MAG: hypothetical protein EP298_05085 [Gammaproteobacteria bacterium]UTW42500.1 hypothetical protein KFE69_13670 [bacterium SCSIO 12844]